MYDIIVGRNEEDKKQLGAKGTIFLGKHYVKMGRTTSLSNSIYLDMARSHVIFICGKRGGGKSYTMGVIAEGMASLDESIKQNLSIILLDTMGIYWTMKYPNKQDVNLLEEWGLEGKGLDVKIFTPVGYFSEFKEKGIPTDYPFAIRPSELSSSDWCTTFGISVNDPMGVLIEKIIIQLQKQQKEYALQDIITGLREDQHSDDHVKEACINRFVNTESWGLFDEKGTLLKDLAVGGQVTVLDVSCYATLANGWDIKNLVIGLVAMKLFIQRMVERRNEEYEEIHHAVHYFGEEESSGKKEMPLVWLVIDEAHEFLPRTGTTTATFPLVTLLREGRQPGISLVLATQQPGKIHTDVMTQADTVIAHRVTAKLDVEALGMLMQSYMREGLTTELDNLPRVKGSAIIFDDSNEKMYPVRIRPRFTWHGGESPVAVKVEKKVFEF
ncbi:ATP-binding protein [Candidatus Woesearchaeota archaeon]|nr:ATP-binding protein [Candidatus Woesearchaeota archaeon]